MEKFSADWFVINVDDDRVADVYAVFEGMGIYNRVTTCDLHATGPWVVLAATLFHFKLFQHQLQHQFQHQHHHQHHHQLQHQHHHQLQHQPPAPTPPPTPAPTPTPTPPPEPTRAHKFVKFNDNYNWKGHEYFEYFHSHNFQKNSINVAIVPSPDNYDQVKDTSHQPKKASYFGHIISKNYMVESGMLTLK